MQEHPRIGVICPTSRQRGSALIVALVMLLLMTLIGVTAMQTTILQERMAGNTRDRQMAFEAAEAALREGESFLSNPSSTAGFLDPAEPGDPPVWDTVDWLGSSATSVTFSQTGTELVRNPAYIIEELGIASDELNLAADEPAPETRMYRITATGWGGSEGAIVRLQTSYRRD
ncbi:MULTISPECIES: PilX N-terminal domain-containing pilus assembly protein [unclassified Thioalkalivibrio]|uniref:pilus assembly PilX family protein n=1 Tax=unclassified Thioalkalivibrio TaxID=2621013 RepID=UPI0003658985|nr:MULTISPECIES: pilus assembly protein [unclassified Thioalkalivibrio]